MLLVLYFPFKSHRCQKTCSIINLLCIPRCTFIVPPLCVSPAPDTVVNPTATGRVRTPLDSHHLMRLNTDCHSHLWFLHIHSPFSVFQSQHKSLSSSLLSSPSFREKCWPSYIPGKSKHCSGFQFGGCVHLRRTKFLICMHTELKLLPQHLYLAVTEKKVTQINHHVLNISIDWGCFIISISGQYTGSEPYQ